MLDKLLDWPYTSVKGQYPIRVVSKMTGLSVDTLRAWERRYRVVKPGRSTRGRLYDDADVQRLLRFHALVAKGYAIGQVAALSDAELDELSARKDVPVPSVPSTETETRAIVAAIEAFDGALVNEELGRLAALLSPVEFVHQVALPVMREVGDRWHAGTMHTAHEHMVTDSLRNLLGAMSRLHRPAEARVRILATTPSDELHEVGVLAASLLAGARGFHITCLGPNLPAAEILYAAECTASHVVLLGLTSPNPLPTTRATVLEVAASLPPDKELWLAGAGGASLMPLDRSGSVFLENFAAFERNLIRAERGIGGLP